MGALLGQLHAHGWSSDMILDHTWPQIYMAAELVARNDVERLNAIVEPILAAWRTQYGRGSVQTDPRAPVKPPTPKPPAAKPSGNAREQQDAKMLSRLMDMPGFKVVGAPSPREDEGAPG